MQNCLMLASFGSTYQQAYLKSVGAIIRETEEAHRDWLVAEAITSRIVKQRLAANQNLDLPNEVQVAANFELLEPGRRVIQPLHLIPGHEYEKLRLPGYELGETLFHTAEDISRFAKKIHFGLAADEALVLMGHGSDHQADGVYAALQAAYRLHGRPLVFVGTVEGCRDFPSIIQDLRAAGVRHLTLRPLMLIAGDHVHNDMLGDEEDSWINRLQAAGFSVDAVCEGLGERAEVRALYAAKINRLLAEH